MTSNNHTKHETIRAAMKNPMVIVLFIGLCLTFTIGIFQMFTENQNASAAEDSPAAAENQPTAIECGSCGAHVYEYWYWENMNDGTPVKICRYCYENCIENTEAENTATEN